MQINVLGYPDSLVQYYSKEDALTLDQINAGHWYKPIELIANSERSSIIKTALKTKAISVPSEKYYAIKRYHNPQLLRTECSIIKYLNEAENNTQHVISLLAIFILQGTKELPYASLYPLYNGDLFDLTMLNKGLSLTRTFHILSQLLEILLFLQKHHVVHQDIKLENFFLKHKDSDEIVLGDFEFAFIEKIEGYDRSVDLFWRKCTYCGTPAFMSPERLLDDSDLVSYPTDIWGAACVAAAVFTSRLIFGKDFPGYLHEILLEQTYADSFGISFEKQKDGANSNITLYQFLNDLGIQKNENSDSLLFLSNLLKRMFVLHPKDRIPVQEASQELLSFLLTQKTNPRVTT